MRKWRAVRTRLAEQGHEGLDGTGRKRAGRASWTAVLQHALDSMHGVEKAEVLHLESAGVHYKCWALSEDEMLAVLRKLWALQKQHREQQDDMAGRRTSGNEERLSAKGGIKAMRFLHRLKGK